MRVPARRAPTQQPASGSRLEAGPDRVRLRAIAFAICGLMWAAGAAAQVTPPIYIGPVDPVPPPCVAAGAEVFATLGEAVDASVGASGALELRVLIGHHLAGETINTSDLQLNSLVISGGWLDCSSTPAGVTEIDLGGSQRFLTVLRTDGSGPTVTLRDLTIRGGFGLQGGILFLDLGARARLVGVTLEAGHALQRGGAILAKRGATLTLAEDVVLVNNTADVDGGAVFVQDAQLFFGQAAFITNAAARHGGAIAAGADSHLASLPDGPADLLFLRNQALDGSGGAIRCASCSMFLNRSSRFVANEATGPNGRGGALSLADLSSRLIRNADFIGNTAESFGGAIDADENYGIVSIDACVFSGNHAGALGSALAFSDTVFGGEPVVSRSFLLNHLGGSSVLHAPKLNLVSSLIADNDTTHAVATVPVGGSWHLAQVTFSNNRVPSGRAIFEPIGNILASFDIANSIFWNDQLPSAPVFGAISPGISVETRCVIADDPDSFPSPGGILDRDPRFVSSLNRDYHLSEESEAIDVCLPDAANQPLFDLDGEAAPIDVATVLERLPGSLHDAGADEHSGVEPAIFGDGFEGGDTTRWSAVTP